MNRVYRQGDVLIVEIPNNTKLGNALPREGGRIVLAYGEATGHCHAIADREATLYALPEDKSSDGDNAWARAARILKISGKVGVELRHEEHATISLPPGTYRVTRQREYSPDELRMVAD